MRSRGPAAAVAAVAMALAAPLTAAEWRVAAGEPASALPAALERAAPGDLVRVEGGTWSGPLVIDRPLHLAGSGWPVVDGGGQGTVLAIRAPGVTVEGLVLRNSGSSLDQENSGIAVEAAEATVRGNRLEDVLFGIYLRHAPGSEVRGNTIRGKDLPLPRRGDAVRVWYSDGVTIADNEVEAGRDVVLWYSAGLRVESNRVRDGRYGLHFMYCDDATIRGNLLYRNSVGAFLMYSRRLRLVGNSIAGNHGPSGYGVGLKDMDDAVVRGNLLAGNRIGVFLDNSPREMGSASLVAGNAFTGNDIGVVLLPNVRRAEFADNGFVENVEQMAVAGQGGDPEANGWRDNHWSDYAGFDLDGDGRGDVPYRAERLFEALSDRHPELRLFLHSPAAQTLDLAARAFPIVQPRPKLTDPSPRMRPPALAAVPALPRQASAGWPQATAGLVAGALLLIALPQRVRRPESGSAATAPTAPRPLAEAPVIVADRLSKRYGKTAALLDLDLRIEAGESVALWGPNGAGKTTALRALLGVVRYRGEARVAGLDPLRQGKAVRRKVGFVPQEIGLRGELGLVETLDFFARLRRTSAERVDELVAWLGLDDHAGKRVGELSGGLRQRLALGIALLGDPPILLLDEPTASLDAAARSAFYGLLLDLKTRGKTLVFTSHRPEEVELLADRVLHLDRGRLVEEGAPGDLRLGAAGTVELHLRLPESEMAVAARLLGESGYAPRPLGRFLAVTVAGDRKAEPLVVLVRAGHTVEDFFLWRGERASNGRV